MMEEGGRMRTHLSSLALLLVFTAGTAPAATRNFGVTGFDRIRVDGPFKVELKTGVAPYASASGASAAIDGVTVEVQGRTLVVHGNPSSWGGYPGQSNGPVEVRVGTHELTAAWLNGSGSLRIDKAKGLTFDVSVQGSGSASIGHVDVDQLNVGLAGTASAVLAGRAPRLTAIVRGISTLDATGLAVKDATIGAEGPATVKANVSNSAIVDGSGAASIALTGRPACTSKLTGSASVSGCR